MGPSGIVELEVPPDSISGFWNRFIGSPVHLLILDAPPQPLDEHVVSSTSLPVHADPDSVFFEQAGESLARELAPLIRVEDLRGAVALQGFFNRLHAKSGVHRDRYPPGQRLTAAPVHHNGKVYKPPGHRYARDIHGPYLVGSGHLNPA